MPSNSRLQLESWLKTIDVKADRVLDIGGSQLPIKDRTKSWEVNDYVILDLEQPHECKQKPDVISDIQNESWYKIKELDNVANYDVAFCIEVAEYWYNPLEALKNISFILRKGGILYISFHFLYPIHRPSGLDYLRYTEHGARKLLEETGFKVEELVYKNMELGVHSYGEMSGVEGMRLDRDYHHHDAQGYLIKAIKI